MPSHVTHALFAQQAYTRAFDSPPEDNICPWLVQGSTGPDFFFASIRRKPSAEPWGDRIHDEGYGRLCAALAGRIDGNPKLETWLYGFCTHAVLDRAAHPLVHYLSGWVDDADPATRHLHYCHPFLERIIDMILLRDLRGMDLLSWKHPERTPTPRETGDVTAAVLAGAIGEAYADPVEPAAIRNAYLDNGDFLMLFDPSGPGGDRRAAAEMERRGELPPRILGLFYPETIPPGDILNEDGSGWRDPRTGGGKRRDSFMDLYTEAVRDAGRILTIAREVLLNRADPRSLEDALGNGDLNDPSPASGGIPLVYNEPLEISSLIDAMYAAL